MNTIALGFLRSKSRIARRRSRRGNLDLHGISIGDEAARRPYTAVHRLSVLPYL